MGFIDDIRRITSKVPRERQTLLFSATMPSEIERLSQDYLNHPEKIQVSSFVGANLEQVYYEVGPRTKFAYLQKVLEIEDPNLALVFCATRRITDIVSKKLSKSYKAEAIHGGITQARRNKLLQDFHKGKVHVLVATDVAARGLDIKDVTHVINYDLPSKPEDYIHRIGRTARIGKKGKAITLLAPRDHDAMRLVQAHLTDKMKKVAIEGFAPKAPPETRPGARQGPRTGKPRTQSRSRFSHGPASHRRASWNSI